MFDYSRDDEVRKIINKFDITILEQNPIINLTIQDQKLTRDLLIDMLYSIKSLKEERYNLQNNIVY